MEKESCKDPNQSDREEKYYCGEAVDFEVAIRTCADPKHIINPDEVRWFMLKEQPDYEKMRKVGAEVARKIYGKANIVVKSVEIPDGRLTLRIRGCHPGCFILDSDKVQTPKFPQSLK